jgi:hypothetical protein
MLVGAVGGNALLTVLAVTWVPLSDLLTTARLDAADIAVCVLVAIPAALTAGVQRRRPDSARSSVPPSSGRKALRAGCADLADWNQEGEEAA